MARRRSIYLLVMLCLAVTCLTVACQRGNSIANLAERLARKQAELTSYQLVVMLEQPGGQPLQITQWYQLPDRLRTDVVQDGELSYQFFLVGDTLTARHLPSGQQEQLRLSSDNALFTSPLLLELWQEAQGASWSESESRPNSFLGEFAWRDLQGEPKLGSIWINAQTLLPEEVSLFFDSLKVMQLNFESIKFNLNLEDHIFQP